MRLIRCIKCKKMYNHISLDYKFCPECTKKDVDTFMHVRYYVKKNPGISVKRVSEDLGIDVKTINRYLKEDNDLYLKEAVKNYNLDDLLENWNNI